MHFLAHDGLVPLTNEQHAEAATLLLLKALSEPSLKLMQAEKSLMEALTAGHRDGCMIPCFFIVVAAISTKIFCFMIDDQDFMMIIRRSP